MKRMLSLLLCAAFLTGCGSQTVTEVTADPQPSVKPVAVQTGSAAVPEYISRFDSVTEITLSDDGITVNGGPETDAVFTSRDIIYYENRDAYDSGNPYGEGSDADQHTPEEAAAHTVINITQPGAYRVSGTLSAGQIRIDLGEDAYEDPDAIAEIILADVDITCTVAPAILFLNTYECDGAWSTDTAQPQVDTTAAGASLILEGVNTVNGSYVAKIFKDKDGEKKLWKQDGAIYSYMSMNVFGPGVLNLTAANEGLDTELHLTLNGGTVNIFSDNDGINTNEDGVSVTTINGGNLTIFAGLGAEGDGIDSNGYLVINGGTVFSSAKPASDAGLDSDLGSFIHGGTVIAQGSSMDWAESDSGQVTLNLQFASQQHAGAEIKITAQDGMELFTFTPEGEYLRPFSGMILSHPAFAQGETYHVYLDGVQMAYTGTDVMRGPGGMHPGRMPENFDPENLPEGFDPSQMGGRGQRPDGEAMAPPEGFDPSAMTLPEGFDRQRPEGMEPSSLPEGETFPEGDFPRGGFGGRGQGNAQPSAPSPDFYMNDLVNFFSGVAAV